MIDDYHTIEDAKRYIERHRDTGLRCPCCNSFLKVYKRKMHQEMAYLLIRLYKLRLSDYHHTNTLVALTGEFRFRGGDWALLRHWGLIEKMPKNPLEDKKSSGFWRITTMGKLFVEGVAKMPSHVMIYNGDFVRFDGHHVSIRECLGKRFSYEELLGGAA